MEPVVGSTPLSFTRFRSAVAKQIEQEAEAPVHGVGAVLGCLVQFTSDRLACFTRGERSAITNLLCREIAFVLLKFEVNTAIAMAEHCSTKLESSKERLRADRFIGDDVVRLALSLTGNDVSRVYHLIDSCTLSFEIEPGNPDPR